MNPLSRIDPDDPYPESDGATWASTRIPWTETPIQRSPSQYPRTENDLYAACVEPGIGVLGAGGMLGAITFSRRSS